MSNFDIEDFGISDDGDDDDEAMEVDDLDALLLEVPGQQPRNLNNPVQSIITEESGGQNVSPAKDMPDMNEILFTYGNLDNFTSQSNADLDFEPLGSLPLPPKSTSDSENTCSDEDEENIDRIATTRFMWENFYDSAKDKDTPAELSSSTANKRSTKDATFQSAHPGSGSAPRTSETTSISQITSF